MGNNNNNNHSGKQFFYQLRLNLLTRNPSGIFFSLRKIIGLLTKSFFDKIEKGNGECVKATTTQQ